VRDISDPTLPEYVRNPVRAPEISEDVVMHVIEMGFPLRKATSAGRLSKDPSTAVGFLLSGLLATDEANSLVEDIACSPSP